MLFFGKTDSLFGELTHKLEILIRGKIWLQALIGLVLGITVGVLLGPDFLFVSPERADILTEWLALPGQLFLRLIKMVLIPLVLASIIRGLGASSDTDKLRTIGLSFAMYVVCTSVVASAIGILVAWGIKPGSYIELAANTNTAGDMATKPSMIMESIPSSIVSLIPVNPLASAIDGEMLGIVVFSIITGIAVALRNGKKTEPLLALLDSILEVSMTIVKWAMLLVPLAVFGLIARMTSQIGIKTLLGVGVYVGTVLLGLFILLLFYLILVSVLGKRNPISFLRSIGSVQLLAFSTSSSAAVMPVSIQVAEEELQVDKQVSEVVVPLGATINMDGTALYQSVAILFLAQISGIAFSIPEIVLIVTTLVLSSIGAPATPGIGMVILGGVAANFGIPTAGLVLILGVDRIVDMCRTALNVTGDLAACTVLDQRTKKKKSLLNRLFSKK